MKPIIAVVLVLLLLTGCVSTESLFRVAEQMITMVQTEISQPTEPAEEAQEQEPVPTQMVGELVLPGEVILEDVGQTVTLYEGEMDASLIQWTSQDPNIATVENGVLTAVDRGETKISAVYNDQVAHCSVICDLPVPMRKDESAGERDPVYLPPDVEIVDDSFFADAVFIGDSQGLLFYNCIKYYRQLEGSMHMARNSYGIESASGDKMLLTWRGKDMIIEDAIEATGANRVFFMLGINDVAHYDFDEMPLLMEMWDDVITRIQNKLPHVQICIQSLPPVWTGGETEKVNNELVREYNRLLELTAKEHGCVFIDLAPYFMDSTGGMATCYSGDKFVHTNPAGADIWVKILKACTDYE